MPPPAEKQEDVEMEKSDQQVSKIDGGEGDGQEESMEELQVKLAKLKEVISFLFRRPPALLTVPGSQAASLGISEMDRSYGPYRGYARQPRRGRGRGRGITSEPLGNRPRKLLVKGVPAESMEVAHN